MIVRNDCVQEDTITVEVNGFCSSITEIVNQTPQIDCDELMVCIGPHLVSLNDLIMRVYEYVQSAQLQNQSNFNQLFNQYNSLYSYFMKCCADIIGRLTRIEKRINGLIVVRQVFIERPKTTTIRSQQPTRVQDIIKPPVVIDEERYVIDQSITTGYLDSYIRYDQYGNKSADMYVGWLKQQEGYIRKLMTKEVPYSKGTLLANNWIENIKKVFIENDIEFDENELTYKRDDVKYSFKIPKLGGKWIVSGNKVISLLDGRELDRFLPIKYFRDNNNLLLESVIKYRIDANQRPVIGYEPVLMTYQVLNKVTGSRTTFDGGINLWIKYS